MKHFQFCFFTSLTSCHKFSHPSFCITISLECKISTIFSFTMPPKRKPSQNLQRVRKHRAIEGGLKSHSVTFPQNVRRKFARIMRDGCKHILANDFVDQLTVLPVRLGFAANFREDFFPLGGRNRRWLKLGCRWKRAKTDQDKCEEFLHSRAPFHGGHIAVA